ncbi:MAG: hypothetical protein K0R39_2018 [Symbiobacteriaceae bacterium]|nr:hypothetical protein [Symbiobacteriaceae bacterium]
MLRQEAFWETIPFEDVNQLAERMHVLAGGLQYARQSGEWDRVYGDRNYLRVITEQLPFPDLRRDLVAYREGIARIRSIGAAPGFTLRDVPPAPPVMQLVVGGLHWPVKQGGYCWSELGSTRCVDMAGPAELAAQTTTSDVKPGSRVELHFAWAPDPGSVKVWQVSGDGGQVPVALGPDLSFPVPQQSGEYVYGAEARWEHGNGSYAFRVKTK